MVNSEELVAAVRSVLDAGSGYLSARQIFERLPVKDQLIQECGSAETAVRRVKEALLKSLQGELSFDFTPNGKKRDVLGSTVPEVSMVFRLRG